MHKKKIFLLVAIIAVVAILLFVIFFCLIKQEPAGRDTNVGLGKRTVEHIYKETIDTMGQENRERNDIDRSLIEEEIKIRDGAEELRLVPETVFRQIEKK